MKHSANTLSSKSQHICSWSGQPFVVDAADSAFYRKHDVPLPRLSPIERQRRRLAFRNFRFLHRRRCDATAESIVSVYRDNASFPVYSEEYWWSGAWSATSCGRRLDLARPFFEQYGQLSRSVPRPAIVHLNVKNSPLTNFAVDSSDSYLVFGCVRSHRCLYGHIVWDSNDCLDNLHVYKCSRCSHSIDLVECCDTHFSHECTFCTESLFLYNCRNCANCVACVNLQDKEFCIFNEQFSPAEYRRRVSELFPLRPETLNQLDTWVAKKRQTDAAVPSSFGMHNEDVSGNHLVYCSRVYDSFDVKHASDSRYCFTTHGTGQSYDISHSGTPVRESLECLHPGDSDKVFFSHSVRDCSDCAYCEYCYQSHDLFGCIGLRNASYCIFNTQYTRQDYFRHRERLISHMRQTGEWGEFFPPHLSPFSYHETVAHEYMPLTKEEALARGCNWEGEPAESEDMSVFRFGDLFVNAGSSNGDVRICSVSRAPFRLEPAERELSARLKLPAAGVSPSMRHLFRIKRRDPRVVTRRTCCMCGKSVESAVSKGTAEKVACPDCFRRSAAQGG